VKTEAIESGLSFHPRETLVRIIRETPEDRLGLLTIHVEDKGVKHILIEIKGSKASLTAVRS
jgi:hypothetical protein